MSRNCNPIETRLIGRASYLRNTSPQIKTPVLLEEAAAEIARLRAEIKTLHAAAPELLDALREAFGYIDCIPETAAGGDDAAIGLAKRLHAAIAKATGEPA